MTVNPSSPAFRHGKSLGSGKNKDWSRVKFGAGRYRLFFRYFDNEKVNNLGWMHDENTLCIHREKKKNKKTIQKKKKKKKKPNKK
ncbi:type II toxin-antitoxin system YhaV family toxin [Escherichia coli]|uniref:type II toxin-antitoxin system YhaV family toxin n=1 Tax=Escherichia coli TaxID=562 RepID=UPI0010CC8904|nr:type II toxin-antitoxin system YhaV family toxin [Escherichia coli]